MCLYAKRLTNVYSELLYNIDLVVRIVKTRQKYVNKFMVTTSKSNTLRTWSCCFGFNVYLALCILGSLSMLVGFNDTLYILTSYISFQQKSKPRDQWVRSLLLLKNVLKVVFISEMKTAHTVPRLDDISCLFFFAMSRLHRFWYKNSFREVQLNPVVYK